ncbi:MAG: hypothetical protein ACE147_02945 [Candidatus Methylomirabilales bacterium]
MHKKSALPEAAPLILDADGRGVDLLWERYERQLPLCGFTSNGLNCRKCFQGPCRINPFGDEPSRGICGADRDQIVMEALFQATLAGVVETLRAGQQAAELPDVAPALLPAARERLAAAGLLPVRREDVLRVQNSYFAHRGYLADTLRDLTRLGLIQYAALLQGQGGPEEPAPALDPQGANLLVLGPAPTGLVPALRAAAQRLGASVNLLGEGAGLLRVPDQGSPELLLGMGVDAVVVSPGAGWPAVEALAARSGIPLFLTARGTLPGPRAAEAVQAACRHAGQRPAAARMGAAAAGRLQDQAEPLERAVAAGRVTGVAVLFGEPNVQQSFFERTLALVEAALAQRAVVVIGGGLGRHAAGLAAEVGRRRAPLLAAVSEDLARDGLAPILSIGGACDIPRVVSLAQGVPAAFAFPEFHQPATWATAVSLLSLGFAVQIGVRLPFWGSPALAGVLTSEWPAISGGRLLAAPGLPDPAIQAEELASLLKGGAAR